MSEPRRALHRPRPGRAVLVMVMTGLVLLGIGTATIISLRRGVAEGDLPLVVSSGSSSSSTGGPATPAPGGSGSAGAEGSAGSDASASADQVLEDCRAKVEAADEVRDAAGEGVGHWAAHVRAQTDANSGEITLGEMDEIFERTRQAGGDDVERYREALDRYDGAEGSCRADQDGAQAVAAELRRCAQRAEAQQPVLEAGGDAMGDWTRHLREMQRSHSGKIHDPQQTWLRRWRAAPKNIKAYQRADRKFDAPRC